MIPIQSLVHPFIWTFVWKGWSWLGVNISILTFKCDACCRQHKYPPFYSSQYNSIDSAQLPYSTYRPFQLCKFKKTTCSCPILQNMNSSITISKSVRSIASLFDYRITAYSMREWFSPWPLRHIHQCCCSFHTMKDDHGNRCSIIQDHGIKYLMIM